MFEDWSRRVGEVDVVALEEFELRSLLRDATALRDAAESLIARAAARLGSSSAVRGATRCTQREADRAVARGEVIGSVPEVGEALALGEISPAHVDTLARAVERTSVDAVAASSLLEVAKAKPADAMGKQVTEFVRRHVGDDELAARFARQRAERRAFLVSEDMGVLHAEFDDSTFNRIRAAIDAEMDRQYRRAGGRDRLADAPTMQQRRADAVAALLLGRSGGAGPVRSTALLVVQADGSGHIPGVGPLPRSEVERLLCVSDLHGIVFSAEGQPLWLGDRVRLATDEQWLALIARDEGCIGCGLNPARCEAHHIRWVRHGGSTDIDNLVLVCSHCHHLIHDGGWRVVVGDDGRWLLVPP